MTKFEEALNAATQLYACVQEMSKSQQILEAFDQQTKLDALKAFPVSDIDPRLGVLSVLEVAQGFKKFGHNFDDLGEESLFLSIYVYLILVPGGALFLQSEINMRMTLSTGMASQAYHAIVDNVQVGLDPNLLLIVELCRSYGVEEELVKKYIIRLYRYLLIIAEADGKTSAEEKAWLTVLIMLALICCRLREEACAAKWASRGRNRCPSSRTMPAHASRPI